MGAQADRRMTAEEFLQWQNTQELRHELVDGVPILRVKSPDETEPRMMTGASPRHSQIGANIQRALGNALEDSPCEVHQNDSGVRVADDRVRYPDVVADCSGDIPNEGLLTDPRIVFEVLSRSAGQADLREKLVNYKSVPTIEAIVYVEQEFADVEAHYRLEGDGWSTVRHTEMDEVLELPSIGVTLSLQTIYRRVRLDPRPRPRVYVVREDGGLEPT